MNIYKTILERANNPTKKEIKEFNNILKKYAKKQKK